VNKLNRYLRFFTLSILLLLIVSTKVLAEPKPIVFVSILPQKFFVQQISKDKFDIEVMVKPGASPHTYEPKPSQMKKLAACLGYFTIGVALEKVWLNKIATINPDMKVIHTEAGIEKIAMQDAHHDDDDSNAKQREGGDGEHDHSGLDPHIWLSPALVKTQAATITDSLVELDPGSASFYQNNFNQFKARLAELDTQLLSLLADKKGMKFMVFHPSWGYFARNYGLEQVAVEIEGKSPKPAHLKTLISQAIEEDIRVIFAQPQFSRKSAGVIAREINGEVVLVDPLGENWFENMSYVADKFSKALR